MIIFSSDLENENNFIASLPHIGTVKIVLRWNFPGHDGDAVADGYQVFVNQKQYGGDLSVHTTNALLEVCFSLTLFV